MQIKSTVLEQNVKLQLWKELFTSTIIAQLYTKVTQFYIGSHCKAPTFFVTTSFKISLNKHLRKLHLNIT